MKKLKLFFACLLMAVLSIGQVWATDETVTYTLTGATTVSVTGTAPDGATVSASTNGSWVTADSRLQLAGKTAEKNYTLTLSGFDGCTITGLTVKLGSNSKAGNAALTFVAGSETLASIASANLNDASWFGGWVSSGSEKTVTLSNDEYEIQEDEDVVLTITNTANSAYVYYVSVTYTPAATGDVIVKTLKSIAVEGMTTSYETGDAFSFDGTCTATYSVTKNDVPQADEEKTVTPTSVTSPDMSSAGVKTITVSFTDEVTKTTTYDINVTAAQPKSTLIFTDEYKDSGATADDDAEWNVTSDAPESTYEAARGIHFGTGSSSQVQYVQLTTSDISGTITKVVVNASDATGTAEISVSVNGTDFTCGGSTTVANTNPGSDYTFTGSASGEIVVRIDRGSAAYKAIYVKSIVVSYIAGASVKKPTFSVEAGSYLDAQSVEINCATAGAAIYYTLDNTDPSSGSTPYTGAIPISETKTLKAIAIKDEVSSPIATATYTITTPLSVTDALALIPNANDQVDNQYVEGFVCTEASSVLSGGKMTYYISADGSETNRLQIYKGKNLDNTNFSNVSDAAKGDKVIVYGQLYNFGGTNKEMNDGNYIVRRTAKGALQSVVVSGTPTKTAYSADEAFEPAGLVVTATYASGYAVNVASELVAADWSASPATVTAEGDINVTATYGGITSAAYPVHVTIVSATLESITLSYDAVEVYQGKDLPKPVVTAHWSDASTSDVTALASFTGYDKDTPGDQTITVSYQFGTGDPEEATYTVTVKPIYNVELAASVAKDLIETVVGNAESTSDMIVRGIVSSVGSISNGSLTYFISDDGNTTNQLEIFKGKYLGKADFTDSNKLKEGDEVVVTGKVIYYSGTTAEFANGKSEVTSLARVPNFEIADVASFEVGAADLAVADLTITQDGEGAVTLASSDNTDAVTIADGKLHAVAVGDATITANLAANGIYKAATAEFNVTVIPATVKYAITFDGNGADGGTAPTAIPDKAAGAEVTLPANTYTYTGHSFTGWKVYDKNEDEVTVTAGAFTMPASPVTIKAQWAEISVWATTYTSNVTLTAGSNAQNAKVVISGTEYDAVKAGTGKAGGSIKVTVPAQATTLHLHAAGWSGENPTISIDAPDGVTVSMASISATADDGINTGSPFTLSNDPVGQYFALSLSGNTEEIELTFAVDGGNKRFVLFGVNQEGGIVPVLKSIAISGDLDNKSYKAGQALDMTGLEVTATYQLGEETPYNVDITNDPGLSWTYDPLVENQTSVTITATYKGQTDDITINDLVVTSADPLIITDPVAYLNWGTVIKGATAPTKTITVTLQNVDAATAALGGTNPTAFSIDDTEIADGDVITVSVVSTATEGSYSAKVILTDNAGKAPDKEINLSITIEDAETPVSTTSEWVPATAADLVDGKVVLITGVKSDVTYAMGEQKNNNRSAVAGTLSEGVFTPGENTMSFTLVATGETDTYYIKASNDKYLYNASTSGNSYLRTKADNEDASWTITLDGDGNAVITSVENTNRTLMRFNLNGTSTPLFNCYASGQQSVKLYVPKPVTPTTYDVTIATGIEHGTVAADPTSAEEGATITLTITPADGYELSTLSVTGDESGDEVTVTSNQFSMPAEGVTVSATFSLIPTPATPDYTREVTIGNYGTICLPNGGTIEGAKLFDLEYYDGASTLYLLEVNGNAMVAGRPYIFLPSATSIEVTYTDNANALAGSFNGLVGSYIEDHVTIGTGDEANYILYQNAYYLVDGPARVGANRAYIHMASVPTEPTQQSSGAPRRRVAMTVNGKDAAQGFENLQSGDAPVKVMIDGTMYILRGEKVFDATGRLVK